MKKITVMVLLLTFLCCSCGTMKESIAVGIGSGMAAGGGSAALLYKHDKSKHALKGALIGGAIGGIASYFIHKVMNKRDAKIRRETLLNLEKYQVNDIPKSYGNLPVISKPTIESQWIDTQVQGKKLIEGHRVWVISEDSNWMLNAKKEEQK